MKRITPRQVVAAYKQTGMRPTTGMFTDETGCGCALGAVLKCRGFNPDSLIGTATAARKLHLPFEYALGFTRGFDGHNGDTGDLMLLDRAGREEHEVGFVDGVNAHLAVIEAGLYVEVES